ncbi:MAG TPA: serine hydrolase domain-containing protein [Candidatus Hydrogenedentes bacterium]|nr:serine hydrolase domain-containing protein [Candidatus Hydrogenedentota bacterium]
MIRNGAFLVLWAFLFAQFSHATEPVQPTDVSADLRAIVVESQVPGLVAALVNTDRIVASGVAGFRRRGSPAMISIDDKFHLGSCSKAMTATVVAMFVEENELSWETPVTAIFPECFDTQSHDWGQATITHLLNHSSGSPHDLRDNGLWKRLWQRKGSETDQRLLLVRSVFSGKPVDPPGTKYVYSNAGYAIAGAIVERISRESWESILKQRLFDPLGMESAGFGPPGSIGMLEQPRGHRENGEVVEPGIEADNPPAIAPAGTVHCSIGDWAKFIQLHLDAAAGKPRLLSAESFQKLHTPANDLSPAYGMGWGVVDRDWAGGRTLTHNGTNTMWFCAVWMSPQKGVAVMAATNQGGKAAEKAVDDAVSMLIRKHLPNS